MEIYTLENIEHVPWKRDDSFLRKVVVQVPSIIFEGIRDMLVFGEVHMNNMFFYHNDPD